MKHVSLLWQERSERTISHALSSQPQTITAVKSPQPSWSEFQEPCMSSCCSFLFSYLFLLKDFDDSSLVFLYFLPLLLLVSISHIGAFPQKAGDAWLLIASELPKELTKASGSWQASWKVISMDTEVNSTLSHLKSLSLGHPENSRLLSCVTGWALVFSGTHLVQSPHCQASPRAGPCSSL